MATEVKRTFNSFAGTDMQVTFGGVLIGELQGLSYTVQREKGPLYTMGSANPRGFSRGKRGIAGLVKRLRVNSAYIGETVIGNTEGCLGSIDRLTSPVETIIEVI